MSNYPPIIKHNIINIYGTGRTGTETLITRYGYLPNGNIYPVDPTIHPIRYSHRLNPHVVYQSIPPNQIPPNQIPTLYRW